MQIQELEDIPEKLCEICHEVELPPWKLAKDPFAGYCDFCKTKGIFPKRAEAFSRYEKFLQKVNEFIEPAVF
ncbi:MAG: hypothetical protein QW331_03760 [Candidatus Woesearchaeota archaeon]